MIQAGPGEGIMLAVYESEAAYDAISDQINGLLAEHLSSVLDGPPGVIAQGTPVWTT